MTTDLKNKNFKEGQTVELDIEGMDCPACALKIEKAVRKIEGIKDIQVNLGSETASVTYSSPQFPVDNVKTTIEKLGYKAFEQEEELDEDEKEKDKIALLKRFRLKIITSITLSLIIFAFGMKEHIGFLEPVSPDISNILSLVLSTIVIFWCGQKFLRGFWAALRNGTADMDTLITIGTMAAYLYSLFVMIFPVVNGVHNHTVYFESAAMIITFLLIGNYLETNLKNRTQYAIKSLTKLQSKDATILKDNVEYKVPIKKVRVDDTVIIKPGERIPVDGVVVEGSSSVDESMISGESIPADKEIGSKVTGGTLNHNGYLKVRTGKTGRDTFLNKIIDLVKDAQKSKPRIQRLGDRVSAVFVPIVIVIALITFSVWYFWLNYDFAFSLLKSVAVLIIACPCALGLATPIAVVLGVGKAAENRILFNNAEAIENVSKVDTIVFDKTGTLTYGKFEVTDISLINSNPPKTENEILKLAASIENFSEHPVARAIVEYYKKLNPGNNEDSLYKPDNFKIISGIGVEARIQGKFYQIGGANLIGTRNLLKTNGDSVQNRQDYNNIYLFEDSLPIGEIKVSDKIKENATRIIGNLKKDYFISLVSGDSETSTKKIADEAGIDDYHYQILPDKKQEIIKSFQEQNKNVAMVGDGINDAPSLSRANIGIAMGTGQDIAIQSADIILVKGELENLSALFKISRKTIRIIKQNLFWAFFYNAAAIPLAAGLLVPWGVSITPVMASMFMAFSDVVTVIGNSMRLKFLKV